MLMMLGFFTIFLTLFWLIVFVLGLSTLLVAVLTKNKLTRSVYAGLCLMLTGFLLWHWLGVKRFNDQAIAESHRKMAGVYVLDGGQSKMGSYRYGVYRDLTVSLNKDNSFHFSKVVPFLSGTRGTWQNVRGLDITYSEFYFEDTDGSDHRSLQFDSDGEVLYIYSPASRGEQPQVELLYFVRKVATTNQGQTSDWDNSAESYSIAPAAQRSRYAVENRTTITTRFKPVSATTPTTFRSSRHITVIIM